MLALTTVSPLQLSPSDRAVMLPTARVPMEHPRSPPFDSHVLARRSSATTVATAATGDASTMTALRTGGPRRSASLPTPPRRPTRTCMPPSRARADAAGAAVKSEVRGLDGVRGQPATGGGAVVCRRHVPSVADRWSERAKETGGSGRDSRETRECGTQPVRGTGPNGPPERSERHGLRLRMCA